jgi:hypothetical protein
VIVNDLHLLWPSIRPHEADPPLVVDSDAVLPGAIALESFQPVSRWETKIVELFRRPHLAQFPQRRRIDPRIDRRHTLTTPQPLGRLVAERSDHRTSI